ncbi:MAG: E3 binding domain-containing protein [Caldilineaceae bacterium]
MTKAGIAGPGQRILAAPAVRKMALDNQIDLADVEGAGPFGRILPSDIRRHLAEHRSTHPPLPAAPAPLPLPPAPFSPPPPPANPCAASAAALPSAWRNRGAPFRTLRFGMKPMRKI